MNVESVMTRSVIAVGPRASIEQAARLMVEHRISGLPVVDDTGVPVGMVSEGDLIVRQRPRPELRWWQLFFSDPERLAREYQKAIGTTVEEVMTRPVVCVRPDSSVEAAAALLHEHRVRRLPVVAEGVLVGIVSRADLVKALAHAAPPPAARLSDAQLVREMHSRMEAEAWLSNRNILVEASNGVLSLRGIVESEAEKEALETMARAIPGSTGLESHLVLRQSIGATYGT
jgi:CBS-domain-containing membrane protein